MKKNLSKRIMAFAAVMLIALLHTASSFAQAKVEDKEIISVWIMKSMKFEGESKEYIPNNYNQVKVYRADGEYACAEIVKDNKGNYIILPHEYGTYTSRTDSTQRWVANLSPTSG